MLSPEDIRARTFAVALRGYDREDVQGYLDEVASVVAVLRDRLETAEAELEADPTPTAQDQPSKEAPAPETDEPGPFAALAEETQRVLEAAQVAGEEIRRRAQEQADRELKAARAEAARIIAEGERHQESVRQDLAALESARGQLLEELESVGRTLERLLREVAPADHATPLGAALAAAARETDDAPHETLSSPSPAARPSTGSDEPQVSVEPVEPAPEPEPVEPAPEPEPVEPDLGSEPEPEPVEPDLGSEPEPAEAVETSEPAVDEPPAATVLSEIRLEEHVTPGDAPPTDPGDVIAVLHPKLLRRVKRGLQNVENSTLDLLRREGAQGDVEQFLPGEASVEVLVEVTREHLARAYAAGHAAAAAPVDGGDPDGATPPGDLGDELARHLVEPLADALRERLTTAFERNAGLPALADQIDATFSEFRGGPAGEACAAALTRAYERGQLDASSAAGVPGR